MANLTDAPSRLSISFVVVLAVVEEASKVVGFLLSANSPVDDLSGSKFSSRPPGILSEHVGQGDSIFGAPELWSVAVDFALHGEFLDLLKDFDAHEGGSVFHYRTGCGQCSCDTVAFQSCLAVLFSRRSVEFGSTSSLLSVFDHRV